MPFIEPELPESAEGMIGLRYMVFDVRWGPSLLPSFVVVRVGQVAFESVVCSVLSG